MRKNIITTISFLIYGVAAAQPAASPVPLESVEAKLRQLALEIQTMRLDLYRLAMRQISSETAPLQSELQATEKRLARMDAEERAARERNADSQRQWSEELLSAEERREMGQFDQAGAEPARFAIEREKLTRRHSEIAQHLQAQSQAWAALSAAVAALELQIRQNSRAPAQASR